MPRVEDGLKAAGVDRSEIRRFVGVFEARITSGVTGAVWQRRTLESLLDRGLDRDTALQETLARYVVNFESGVPVHGWELTQ